MIVSKSFRQLIQEDRVDFVLTYVNENDKLTADLVVDLREQFGGKIVIPLSPDVKIK